MSLRHKIADELVALTITSGSHLICLEAGETIWSFPVIDGRVGPLSGSEDAHHREDRMAEELAMVAALEGVSMRRERRPGLRAEQRWISASSVARCLRGDGATDGASEKVQKPELVRVLDAFDALTDTIVQSGTYAEVLDLCVRTLLDLHPNSIMLHSDGSGGWISPQGLLLGRTDRLGAVAFEQRLEVAPPTGEAYEPLIGSPPLTVLVPFGADTVLALPWSDDGVQGQPLAATIVLRLFRIAMLSYVGRPQRDS